MGTSKYVSRIEINLLSVFGYTCVERKTAITIERAFYDRPRYTDYRFASICTCFSFSHLVTVRSRLLSFCTESNISVFSLQLPLFTSKYVEREAYVLVAFLNPTIIFHTIQLLALCSVCVFILLLVRHHRRLMCLQTIFSHCQFKRVKSQKKQSPTHT